jgi:hypothetical protein
MNNLIRDYNLHNIVSMRITYAENLTKRLLGNTRVEYENFGTPSIDEPDITVRLGSFKEKKEGCWIQDNKYYVREGYLFCKDSYRGAKWKIELNGLNTDKIELNVSFNSIASLSISGYVIDPLLNIILNRKGLSLVHASGACKNGSAYLFTSQGGGGKTSTALNLTEKGFDFMGDNYMILDREHALGFLSPLNVFSFNLLPSIKKSLGARKSME